MAKRRPSGDDMVRKRDNGRWESRIVVGHKENGESIFRYIYADTQKELTAKLHQDIDAYRGVEMTEQSRMSLSEWLDKWLDERMVGTIRIEKGGKLTAGDTKTYAGKRIILLPSSTEQLLRERRKSALTQWVFPDLLKPERPTRPEGAYRQLKKILTEAGLPSIRFHDLRHTLATHALVGGVDAKTLSGILGHTKASFTLDTYAHVTGDMQRHAAQVVGDFIKDIL